VATARGLAVEALVRIEDGAYANLLLPTLLARSDLSDRDRHLVTELVYGTTRMRRAVDWLVDIHLRKPVEPEVRAALRLGAYQLVFLGTPPHAAVGETVEATPVRARSVVNAVLRKVAGALPPAWPDEATALSYPDWVVDELERALGRDATYRALVVMDSAPTVSRRADGYVQDRASQWVAELVAAQPGDVVIDLCAGPGGKATGMAAAGPELVAALDVQLARAGLIAENAARLGRGNVATVVADARRPPVRAGSADRVLVDAPCSGLGVLRRRPDARWRMTSDDIPQLADLQRELLDAAVELVRPGGELTYSVCTLTTAETVAVDEWLATAHPAMEPLPPPGPPWEAVGRGARLLPQAADTDGMYLLRLRRS
jgi:16S rRNA (cytosine967-C5)-methyltransferase